MKNKTDELIEGQINNMIFELNNGSLTNEDLVIRINTIRIFERQRILELIDEVYHARDLKEVWGYLEELKQKLKEL